MLRNNKTFYAFMACLLLTVQSITRFRQKAKKKLVLVRNNRGFNKIHGFLRLNKRINNM